MGSLRQAIILGVGPVDGLGGQLALHFGSAGHHVLVAGRTGERLDEVCAAVRAAGGEATPVVTDATDESSVKALYSAAAEAPGELDLAIYNAGNNMPGRVADIDADFFEMAWRVCCFGGFLFAQGALQAMRERGGCLLFTGASASLRGKAGFGAFNSAKGALRNLAQAIAKEHGKDGIHVGHVIVDGGIDGQRLKERRPERFAEKGNEGLVSLAGIVASYDYLYRQSREAWTFELDLRNHLEDW